MPAYAKNLIVRLACGAYRSLLYAYPLEFRSRYGVEMNQVFRDHLRDTLSNRGIAGLFPLAARTAWDLSTSVLRERFTLHTFVGMLWLAAALGFASYAAHVDHHNVSEVYPTLLVVLVGSFVLGIIRPTNPWRWAIIVGIGVPFFGPLFDLPARLTSPGRWAMLAIVLVPGLIGAYIGYFLRRAIAAPQ
jgi:hypothetical protein